MTAQVLNDAWVHPLHRLASDNDRDYAIARLTHGLQRGQLTIDEHAQRLDAALRSRTVGDLVLVTRDVDRLPPPAPPSAFKPSPIPTVSLVFSLIGLVAFPVFVGGVVGTVLGLIGMAEVRSGRARSEDKARAVGGLVTGLVAILAGLLFVTMR